MSHATALVRALSPALMPARRSPRRATGRCLPTDHFAMRAFAVDVAAGVAYVLTASAQRATTLRVAPLIASP